MRVKIDTSEKYHVITIQEQTFSAIMTENTRELLLPYLRQPTNNLIINLQDIQVIEDAAAHEIINIQQTFLDHNASFVLCSINTALQQELEQKGLLDDMNVVPTMSEAWDIVQMEEIERELLADDESPLI